MNRYYVINKNHVLSRVMFIAIASWVIALVAITFVGLIFWLLDATTQLDVTGELPRPLSIVLGLCGAYAALGAICLYVTMWVYWIAVQRSPLSARIGWLIALIFGMHYGALLYACHVWSSNLVAVDVPPPISNS
jgi:hypothetical protein